MVLKRLKARRKEVLEKVQPLGGKKNTNTEKVKEMGGIGERL